MEAVVLFDMIRTSNSKKVERCEVMMKKIQGAYPTLEETVSKIDQLLKEGYRADNITVVAKKEKIEAIHAETLAEVDAVLTNESPTSVWDTVKNVFLNKDEEDNPLKKYGFDKKSTETYNTAIKNGEYVVLVDDETNQPASNEGIQPIITVPAGNTMVSGTDGNPILPRVEVKPEGTNATFSDSNQPTSENQPKNH